MQTVFFQKLLSGAAPNMHKYAIAFNAFQVKSSQVAFNKNVTSAHLYNKNVMNTNTNNKNK